ncbi:MAG: beta-ketoacyl-ACP synthase II [Lentisphaeria bacterium]|nr:beta-ketoacyl-ACP synthase II [Lentisphaeria bacterium]
MNYRRVVITGTGVISCVGNTVPEFWDAVVNGRCGIGPVTLFDVTEYRTKIAGEVKNFDITRFVSPKDAKHMDKFCQYAVAAAHEALTDAGLPLRLEDAGIDPLRAGVLVASGIGGMATLCENALALETRGPGRVSPFMIPKMISDMASGEISILTGAMGPNFGLVSACASACHAIGEASWMIRRGDADMMITGGTEASIIPVGMAGFCALKAMSTRNDDPLHASRPFDLNRDGFVMSDGAGVLVIEELEHARKRGANILAEIVGYGASGDAYHMTAPREDGAGAAAAIRSALRNAGLSVADVDYVNAHGTSTQLNERCETAALKTVFGAELAHMSVSSTKGTTGHALGAAGGLETIVCAKAIATGIVPPTINFETPDPACDIDVTPNVARERKIDVALNTNLGFGGHNGAILLSRVKD